MLSNTKVSALSRLSYPNINNAFRDSYIFEFLNLPEPHSEKDLQKGLIQQMKNVILELGKDFIFIAYVSLIFLLKKNIKSDVCSPIGTIYIVADGFNRRYTIQK